MTPGHPLSLKEIVNRLGGELVGDGEFQVAQINTLEHALPDQISFLTHGKYKHLLCSTRAGAVILNNRDRDLTSLPRILCDNPYVYFARVSMLFNPKEEFAPGIHSSAQINSSAKIAHSAFIGPLVSIDADVTIEESVVIESGCVIGKSATIKRSSHLFPNVVIYKECIVGQRVALHSGVVIGADGFGMALDGERWIKIPQIGRVVIGDDVEVGANTTIDRGTLSDTLIDDGVKLDNQIQVGHNVHIGAHTAIAGCVGISGSTVIGKYCKIGGGAVLLGHLSICERVDISAGTVVTKSINRPGTYTGIYPFGSHRDWLESGVNLRRISELKRIVKNLDEKNRVAK